MNRVESDRSILESHQLYGKQYILAVSSLSPHKNFATVIRAVAAMNAASFQLVVVGGADPKVFGTGMADLPLQVRYLGYVSDGELKALYEDAACFVFPSLYEGFGLPPIEAMVCGCPVIAAASASIPEVCGDGAWYFDPANAMDLAGKIALLLGDDDRREQLRRSGRRRAQQLTWARAALQNWEVIRNLL